MRLENWAVVSSFDPYQAPELAVCRLQGNVYGHPKFKDGDTITTSEIVSRNHEYVVTASGSRYVLGRPKEEYEKAFPNALARLYKSLE